MKCVDYGTYVTTIYVDAVRSLKHSHNLIPADQSKRILGPDPDGRLHE